MPHFLEALRQSEIWVSVKDPQFGAVGDGIADDTDALQAAIDYCVGTTASPHGTWTGTSDSGSALNQILFMPKGIYKITAPLTLAKVVGLRMLGAGRLVTTIYQNTDNVDAFSSNGLSRCHFEGFSIVLDDESTGTNFDADWDNTSGGNALQSNNFTDIDFNGGAIGLDLGETGFMGSETLIENCFFTSHSVAGIRTGNYNALQTTIIGGNIQGCSAGILVASGSVAAIISTGFQESGTADIIVQNSANDTMAIIGCRSESVNFFVGANGITVAIIGCVTTSTIEGNFVNAPGCQVTIDCCVSVAGKLFPGRFIITNSSFGREDWINDAFNASSAAAEITNVMYGGTPNYDNPSADVVYIKRQQQLFNGGLPNKVFNYESGETFPKTGAYTLTNLDSGKKFTNSGAAAIVPFALPSADGRIGDVYKFVVLDADGIRVTAVNPHTIKVNATTSVGGGKIESTEIGSAITLRCISDTAWAAESSSGVWTVT